MDLEFLSQHQKIIEGCEGRIKWSAMNAVFHLKKAKEISEIDPLMAAFRSVCAEEEAATALIASLQEQNYLGSEKINFRSHNDKHTVIVFIQAVILWLEKLKTQIGPAIGRHRLFTDEVNGRLAIRIGFQLGDTKNQIVPNPPLHLITQGDKTLADVFEKEVNAVLGKKKLSQVKRAISSRANFRNKLLYATPQGPYRHKGDISQWVMNQAGIVNSLLIALALVDPWRKPEFPHSGIVIALIDVFLKLVSRLEKSS
ncbi:hypothetical protein [Pseudomonas sp. SED1]|uniref:hypothetical protein n=1 Tax=Pseudomonas sp. SED1 TaxID=3056845 RepID=UPI00296F97C2|nr:hypothetical protein [Pseudomonas sp. SED1]MDY0836805.1 hypothetical protein [Pseudomonas sp. SED1]